MAWTAPMTAVAGSVYTAAQHNTFVRDNLLETAPAKATGVGRHFITSGVNSIVERQCQASAVGASETTTSTSYTDLATPGPSVTLTTGTSAWITVTAFASNNTNSSSTNFSHEVSGATSSPASDSLRGLYTRADVTGLVGMQFSATYLRTDLTAGSNTFTMKYKVSTGTGTYSNRNIAVFPL